MAARPRAALAALALLLLAACGSGAPSATPTATVTAPAATPAPSVPTPAPSAPTPAPTVTGTAAALPPTEAELVRGDCSSRDVPADLPDVGVTAAVQDTREAVFAAAVACDYETLAMIAAENPDGFRSSVSEESEQPVTAAIWRDDEAQYGRVMFALAAMLRIEPRERVGSDGADEVVWPPVFSEEATAADWAQVVEIGLLTQEEADLMREGGSGYLGWRTGIDAEGNWDFLLAGD